MNSISCSDINTFVVTPGTVRMCNVTDELQTWDIMEGRDIKMVAAGPCVFAAIDTSGQVWYWRASAGVRRDVAINTWSRDIRRWNKEYFLQADAAMVACGRDHTLVVTKEHELYVYGYNSFGQLGFGNYRGQQTPEIIGFDGAEIAMAAAGAYHSMALTTDGRVYTFGTGISGALGLGKRESLLPEMIGPQFFSGSRVIMIAAGGDHSAAVTTEGALFTWGCGINGQLGLRDRKDRQTPTCVGAAFGDSGVCMIACGLYHTLAVTQDGALFTWGKGKEGQLGLGDTHDRLFPTRVDARCFQDEKIVTVSGGYDHSAAVTETGKFYQWGVFGAVMDHTPIIPTESTVPRRMHIRDSLTKQQQKHSRERAHLNGASIEIPVVIKYITAFIKKIYTQKRHQEDISTKNGKRKYRDMSILMRSLFV